MPTNWKEGCVQAFAQLCVYPTYGWCTGLLEWERNEKITLRFHPREGVVEFERQTVSGAVVESFGLGPWRYTGALRVGDSDYLGSGEYRRSVPFFGRISSPKSVARFDCGNKQDHWNDFVCKP